VVRFGVCTFGSPKYVVGSPIAVPRREECIEKALANKLEQRSAAREAQRKAAQKEIEEFTGEFLNAAKQVFLLIDKDNSGTLDKGEIIKAVKEDEKVKSFLATCGEPNLEFLTQPARLHKALEVLDTSKDGEVDMEECTASRRLTYFSSDRRACSAAWRCASLTARLGWHGRVVAENTRFTGRCAHRGGSHQPRPGEAPRAARRRTRAARARGGEGRRRI